MGTGSETQTPAAFMRVCHCGDERRVVVLGLDEVGLDPGDALPGVDEQVRDAVGREAAVLVHLVAALLGDGLDAALEADGVGAGKEVHAGLVPEIDAGLEADGDGALGELFEQSFDLPADAEDFVDEVDVVDAAGDELVDLVEDGGKIAFAVLVAEQGLVAEGAGPGTATGELDFGAKAEMVGAIAGKDVVLVAVALNGVVGEIERPEGTHVGGTEAGRGVDGAVGIAPDAAGDHLPGRGGEQGQGLVVLAAKDDVGAGLLERGKGRGGAVGADDDDLAGAIAAEGTELRDPECLGTRSSGWGQRQKR